MSKFKINDEGFATEVGSKLPDVLKKAVEDYLARGGDAICTARVLVTVVGEKESSTDPEFGVGVLDIDLEVVTEEVEEAVEEPEDGGEKKD